MCCKNCEFSDCWNLFCIFFFCQQLRTIWSSVAICCEGPLTPKNHLYMNMLDSLAISSHSIMVWHSNCNSCSIVDNIGLPYLNMITQEQTFVNKFHSVYLVPNITRNGLAGVLQRSLQPAFDDQVCFVATVRLAKPQFIKVLITFAHICKKNFFKCIIYYFSNMLYILLSHAMFVHL